MCACARACVCACLCVSKQACVYTRVWWSGGWMNASRAAYVHEDESARALCQIFAMGRILSPGRMAVIFSGKSSRLARMRTNCTIDVFSSFGTKISPPRINSRLESTKLTA